jgi:hypothetical protein
MRRYGLYDATRGLMTALAVGLAGLLLWVATQVGVQSTTRFWAAMGIVAGGGLVLALLPALGGWTSGLRLRISPGALLLGVLPALVVTGWILLATQPGNGWHEGRFVSWSHDLGLMGIVHALGLWHGALAFGFGVVLGLSLDSLPVIERVDEVVPERRVVERRPVAADEPLTQERDAVPAAQAERRDRVTTVE